MDSSERPTFKELFEELTKIEIDFGILPEERRSILGSPVDNGEYVYVDNTTYANEYNYKN
jgi:hypothetical protein